MKSLTYRTSKTKGQETIYVTIKLADECKNGHQDFSITGDLYQADKPKTDRYNICGGCIHEEIEKFFPEFKMFIDLHLSDYRGIPMYAVANGYYNLKNGFNRVKVDDAGFKDKFCEYYRLTAEQFDKLSSSESTLHFGIMLNDLEVYKQWKKEADEAIKKLEELTGEKFEIDSPEDS